jgi:RNA polymerase sigma-70 factor (ECF subfamily)
MPVSDQQLIERILAGSDEAFRDLVRHYQRPVFSLIVRMVRDPSDAEDLAQEVFVKAYRALGSYDLERKFSSWLFKIAHNASIDRLRKKQLPTVPLETPDDEAEPLAFVADRRIETPEAAVERGELAQAFETALKRLRPEYREVMLLRFQQGMAYEEIAEVAGLPLGTVKTHIYRARKAMARDLERLGWGRSGKSAK